MTDPRPLNFAVIGAGAWGTAMAIHLARRGQHTTLVTRRAEHAVALNAARENQDYLAGIKFPDSLVLTDSLKAALGEADVALIACPSQSLRAWCEQIRRARHNTSRLQLFLSLVKGLEIDTHLRPSEIMLQLLPDLNCGTLTGPTNAAEVARGLPAAMVMAAARNDASVTIVQAAMSGPTLRIYTSDDLAGAEYGGSLKNIYAIAAGLCDGLKLGDNSKAALLTRAVAEMLRVGSALGAKPETFYGLSGFGDLVATSHGEWSRNREFGEKIGAGKTVSELLAGRKTVVEGHRTAEALHGLCKQRGITAPILAEVYAILYENKKPAEALHALMTRELKRETSAPFART
ncbi:NAD(P)H-dependent glycerol-3-phosphate dehydrogenase [Oleiharenicola lentus]|uniref:NAD(P)H-dependent glycerol-3-phosphate dehydrogenase n=1 Tax=Oleiharenicola lentus TaxID=2508720 RepID=UPI003F663861